MIQGLLSDGEELGIRLSYKEQPTPGGIAQAFVIGADFVGDSPVGLILGDNIFYGNDMIGELERSVELQIRGEDLRISCPGSRAVRRRRVQR